MVGEGWEVGSKAQPDRTMVRVGFLELIVAELVGSGLKSEPSRMVGVDDAEVDTVARFVQTSRKFLGRIPREQDHVVDIPVLGFGREEKVPLLAQLMGVCSG